MADDESGRDGKRGKKGASIQDHTDDSSNKQSEQSVVRNVQAIVDLERQALDERKHLSRLSTVATQVAGSPGFIIGHIALFAVWIILNTSRFAFDRSPFDILNLILTFEAILLASIVLISQRDLRRLSDMRAHLDLQVNILAEQELTAILGLLTRIGERIGLDPAQADPDVEQLSKETDVRTIATAIEKHLDD